MNSKVIEESYENKEAQSKDHFKRKFDHLCPPPPPRPRGNGTSVTCEPPWCNPGHPRVLMGKTLNHRRVCERGGTGSRPDWPLLAPPALPTLKHQKLEESLRLTGGSIKQTSAAPSLIRKPCHILAG